MSQEKVEIQNQLKDSIGNKCKRIKFILFRLLPWVKSFWEAFFGTPKKTKIYHQTFQPGNQARPSNHSYLCLGKTD